MTRFKETRRAVTLAVRYWPNSHLGDYTPREDIRSAFRFIRARIDRGFSVESAASELESDAIRHANC